MEIKLFDSELKVMDVLWKQGGRPGQRDREGVDRRAGLEREHDLHAHQALHEKRVRLSGASRGFSAMP